MKVNKKKMEELELDKKVSDLISTMKKEQPTTIKYQLMSKLGLSNKQVDESVLRLYRGF